MNKPEFNFSDLVHVAGYEPQLFVIDGYREEHYRYPGEDWVDLVYECHDFFTGEWIEADAEDLSLVASAEDAEEYLAGIVAPVQNENIRGNGLGFWFVEYGEADVMAKQERKPTARELSNKEAADRKKARKERAEQIDNLLDMRNWNSEMLTKTGNEEFGDRVVAIDCELKKLTETE